MIDTTKKNDGFTTDQDRPIVAFDDSFFQEILTPRSGLWPFPQWVLRRPITRQAIGFSLDMYKTDGKYVIECELPGFKKEDFKIEVVGHRLTISTEKKSFVDEKNAEYLYREREFGSYYRTIEFAQPIDEKTVDAKYENGILKIMVPIRSSENSKRIAVSS